MAVRVVLVDHDELGSGISRFDGRNNTREILSQMYKSAVFAAVEFGKSGILLAANLNISTCGISERVPASDAFTSSAVIDVSEFCLLYSSARYAYSAFIRSFAADGDGDQVGASYCTGNLAVRQTS